ncbi:hypothetical protein SEA_SIXAMA_25 [Gordonia phage Sixama]|uniref:Uncharacterized protein n=1 Tax=Gordonia phage Sixama TaxID=2653271 RepID=A0A5Q2F542_9CAUD|nr:hypothetical protein PP302_gp025 [Gordonia phage Sixama]QGF20204.1 hypothetical protein SEA_SIXAMA_25 [Gordonia phage Sixama]
MNWWLIWLGALFLIPVVAAVAVFYIAWTVESWEAFKSEDEGKEYDYAPWMIIHFIVCCVLGAMFISMGLGY